MRKDDETIIDKSWFNAILGLTIGANMVVLGVETDLSCVGCEEMNENLWFVINSIFASIYVIEFTLKLYYKGWEFLSSVSSIVDSLLVLLAVVDTWVLYFVFKSGSMRTLSMLRIVRVVRLSRMLKFMTHQTELRLLIQSFHDIHKVLLPMILFGTCIIYFGSLLIRGLFHADFLAAVYPSYSTWSGTDYWGTIPQIMFTLFQLTTGDNWAAEVARPVIEYNPWYCLFFIPFIMIMTLAFKYAIIAKLCDQIIESGSVAANRQKNQDAKIRQLIQNLRTSFKAQNMTRQSLETFLASLTPERITEISDMLNLIESKELCELFDILNVDKADHIVAEDYFGSLTRLSGPALGKHVTCIQIQANSLAIRSVEVLARVAKIEDRIHAIITDQFNDYFPSSIGPVRSLICA
jgi:hypothetical protein